MFLLQAVAETPVTETPEVTEPEEKVEKEAAVEEKPAPDAAEESEEPENLRKIFAGGLNRDTSDEKFKEFFSQFGNITDGVVIKDQGQSEWSAAVLVPSTHLADSCFKSLYSLPAVIGKHVQQNIMPFFHK